MLRQGEQALCVHFADLWLGRNLDEVNVLLLDVFTTNGPCGQSAKEITFNLSNNEIPMIDGVSIDYAPKFLFKSPYLNSGYKSGIVEVKKGDHRLLLDLN